jgi:DNA-binding transcriptional LysR family regulator
MPDGNVVPEKVLDLSSYHAIVACAASGIGIAIVPRSVLETVRVSESIAVYPMPEQQALVKTYLVWRKGETSPAPRVLQAEVLESGAQEQQLSYLSRGHCMFYPFFATLGCQRC